MATQKLDTKKLAGFILRAGLALTFLYAAIASFLDPSSWVGFLPQFLRDIFPVVFLLTSFSLYELALALWLLSGKQVKYAAILSAVTLFFIMASNLSQLDILFRDVAIFFSAVALAVLELKRT